MVMMRGAFSHLLAPGFRKVIFETYKERPIEGTKLVNRQTSKRAYEEDFELAGFGTLRPKVEGGPVPYEDIKPGTTVRYTWTTYALGFRITQEMMEDDLYGIMGNKLSRALGKSARNNAEIVMHAPYNNAFNTAYYGFRPGESLIGDHQLIRGGTLRNGPATDVDLSLPALQAAVEHFHALTDESGIPAVYIPNRLIHGVSNLWIANQLLKSPQLPGTNLNDKNELANQGITPHLSHYLVDDDAWFVTAEGHDINYWERRAFTVSSHDDFRTGDAEFKGTRRNGSGFGGWRGVYGSAGE